MKKFLVLLVFVTLFATSVQASAHCHYNNYHHHRDFNGELISISNVREIITECVHSRNVRFEKIKLDHDDDYLNPIYEVEFCHGGCEYEADVDAVTGKILKFKRDD